MPDRPQHGDHVAPPDPGVPAPSPRVHRRPAHEARRQALRGTASIAVVTALAGALFVANARLAHGEDERHPQDLTELQRSEESRRSRLFDQVTSLRTEVDTLTAQETGSDGIQWQSAGAAADVAAGSTEVTGPGVTVRLDDAPLDGPRPPGVTVDDLVVHQQDLQAVINALWSGGAEAMALMDQRVISTSAFQCIGNVLSLQGRRYSPPYEVRAIGDPDELKRALLSSRAVRAYLSYVDEVGLGWSLTVAGEPLRIPAYDGAVDMTHATVPDGTEVLPGLVAGKTTGATAAPEH